VTFFEKLQARETAKPGTISKMFSSHPPTGDRIEKTKDNIELVLPDKEEYVVTTSEFTRIKSLLARLENRQPTEEESNKPSLRRRTTPRPDANDEDVAATKDAEEAENAKKDSEDRVPEDDERPTLKRRNP